MGVRRNKNGDDVFDASDDAIRWLKASRDFSPMYEQNTAAYPIWFRDQIGTHREMIMP